MNFKLQKQGVALILIFLALMFSGCASIVSRSSYPISINSSPSGARVTVTDQRGTDIYSGSTPAMLQLKAGAGFFVKASYTVAFELEGYAKEIAPVNFTLDGWYFGNIIFGGLIGILIIDPASGAMWKLETEFIDQTLSRTTANVDQPSLEVFGFNDIPSNWKEKLVRIN